ncbi:hypothetical protein COV42_02105 [Candidatus Campbellbacteria bacterium CG11_big_fil_rev_8_21_14_0_20_44_21]|uniref:Uncharacterized protein n=1 Tax=Candidatus Campbellbacteria bacterium CG22_combo_CG10-13_8_21_14_all_43_18 TaxID=1974530 RepID=A0A2H0DXR0_9BACT|nr:MAG: hypothetical protein COW82_01720 [Candidatus Campbellbacteria bacterium CG22_combo_CG10-13_8_21_14_all_43_18]PIR24219.1 MAG: hypothetical protein COV42_02105 [Candidatus Campbellbacteria bacterium CG11_big_fil_rev_8_21_14_0_20_44_21]
MNALNDLKWLIGMLLLLFIGWILLGSKGGIGGPFIKPPGPLGTGKTYGDIIIQGEGGTIGEEINNIKTDIRNLEKEVKRIESAAQSVYKGRIEISGHQGAKQSSPLTERVELRVGADAAGKIPLSGWRLQSGVSGATDTIGKGTELPYSGQVNPEMDIFVKAGERIIVSTGRSPIGSSFRTNKCTGYFEQFQDFNPSLERSCPRPIDDLPNVGAGNEAEKCIDFVEKLPRCEVYLKEVPPGIGGTCHEYVTSKVNYNNCVENHKDDLDFYKNEWRIYLGRNDELWKSQREIIKLIDTSNKVVDVITY